MTIDELEEFIDDEYDIEFANDSVFGEWMTVEQELTSLHKALLEPELCDSWGEIKNEIKFMEKIKDKDYRIKYALNGMWSQGWVICEVKNDNYKFIDFYRVI